MKKYFLILLIVTYTITGCEKNEQKPYWDDTPLYAQMGASPKMYTTFTVTPETQDSMSPEFQQRWETIKAEVEKISGGPRRLRSFEIKFTSSDELSITYTYNTATGSTARAIMVYKYVLDSNGYMILTFSARDANGRLMSPALFAFQEDYIERYPFRLEWIDDIIPGSKGKVAAYYKEGDHSSYIYGTLSK